MNNGLKEKEMIRDYYLKRAIIYSLSEIATIPIWLLSSFFVIVECDENSKKIPVVLAVGAILWIIFVVLEIYYTNKFWKAHKECQELANPTLSTETHTHREREREIILPVDSQWGETLVY